VNQSDIDIDNKTAMQTLLIIDPKAGTYQSEIDKRKLHGLNINAAADPEQAATFAPHADIILGRPDFIAPVLEGARKLKWVQSTYAGSEPLCAAGLRTDYLLTGVKGVFGPLMSEYVFGHILARERDILGTHENQLKRLWDPIPYRGLDGLTIGIIGLGSIGMAIARTAASFNMRVLGMKRTPGESSTIERMFLPAERSEFLPQLDYLVNTLPDTAETRGFIRLADLKMMKETSILINVGRGTSVDETDLLTALSSGYIGGAILDVFEQEPLPDDSPLWDMPQVIITPHNSAYSFPDQIVTIFCNNYRNYCSAQPLDYVVDFDRSY